MSKIRREQDRLTVIILTQLEHGQLRREDLLKQALNQCGTRSRFRVITQYLLDKGFIKKSGKKGNRSPYTITAKGKQQLALLKNNP